MLTLSILPTKLPFGLAEPVAHHAIVVLQQNVADAVAVEVVVGRLLQPDVDAAANQVADDETAGAEICQIDRAAGIGQQRSVDANVGVGRIQIGDLDVVADVKIGDDVAVEVRGRALEEVGTDAAGERIVTGSADQEIAAGAAIDHIVAEAAAEIVISAKTGDVIVTVAADNGIVAVVAYIRRHLNLIHQLARTIPGHARVG